MSELNSDNLILLTEEEAKCHAENSAAQQNVELWNKVWKTNPKFTKSANDGRRNFTNITPYSQIREATRIWGSYGSTWGIRDLEYDFSLLELGGIAMLKATFFYPNGSELASFEIHNTAKVRFKSGAFDDDFAKKMETNTITKALSRLGFNADVFLGMFDDAVYVESVANEIAVQESEDKELERKAQKERFYEWLRIKVTTLEKAPNLHALNVVYQQSVEEARQKTIALNLNPDKSAERLKTTFDACTAKFQASHTTQGAS